MQLEIWQLVLLIIAGVFAGWLNVLAGGGSMLTVPIMLFLGLDGAVANGTNRIAILAQNISASLTFFKSGIKNLKLGITLALATLPGAVLGSYLGVEFTGPMFEKFLAFIMLGMMLLMITSKKTTVEPSMATHQPNSKQLIIGHFCMVAVGFWGGFIQIGVGLILMPVLSRVMGFDLVRVNALKVFIVLCYTLVALTVFISQIEVLWVVGLSLAAGNSIGGWLGARTSIKGGQKLIKRVLYCVLIVFILKLLLAEQAINFLT